jgi:hypothetical protein
MLFRVLIEFVAIGEEEESSYLVIDRIRRRI